MGEVYRARDARLGRDVAVKVLPESFAKDAERLARFEREAKVLASLNHPHIAAIYGLEETDGGRALVMELVEGPTLAERIAQGPLPLDEALAHRAPDRRGARGGARARRRPPRPEAGQRQAVRGWPGEGARLRPRQGARSGGLRAARRFAHDHRDGDPARRHPRHRRLHEPRAGARPGGRQALRHLGFRLRPLRDADREARLRGRDRLRHPRRDPARRGRLERACRRAHRWRCASSSPTAWRRTARKRLHDIGDASFELDESMAGGASPAAPPHLRSWRSRRSGGARCPGPSPRSPSPPRSGSPWRASARPRPQRPSRAGSRSPASRSRSSGIALSPDGREILAYDDYPGRPRILRRSLESFDIQPIAGTEGCFNPFFSPDGREVAFFLFTRQLCVVPLAGGTRRCLAPAEGFATGHWGADGTIVYSHTPTGAGRQGRPAARRGRRRRSDLADRGQPRPWRAGAHLSPAPARRAQRPLHDRAQRAGRARRGAARGR